MKKNPDGLTGNPPCYFIFGGGKDKRKNSYYLILQVKSV